MQCDDLTVAVEDVEGIDDHGWLMVRDGSMIETFTCLQSIYGVQSER